MSIDEMKAAFKWGMESIDVYNRNGETVPPFVYERTLQLAGELIKELEVECGG